MKWVKRVHTYDMRETLAVLREALTTNYNGPKVIVAEGECQLNRQRRVRPLFKKAVADGERVVRERFGIDAALCTGDHSCIRLSGCPSLTVKENPDPLRTDPGRARRQLLRGVRRVRGGGARGGAVPVLLPCGHHL